MKKILATILAIPLAGCLWICRVPFPVVKQYSSDGDCTNRVWRSMITDCRTRGGTNCVLSCYYPTIEMRFKAWRDVNEPIDETLTGEDLYKAKWRKRLGWIPVCITWLGAPLDAAVDTIMLPYDYMKFKEATSCH